jgi:hypothetical protein
MTSDAAGLLKMLASGVRPAGVAVPGTTPRAAGIESGQFAELLSKARAGELGSNRPVTIDSDAAGSMKLTDDQLAKIALAADKAEAEGVRTALVVLDDQQVLLDVSSRTVTSAARLGNGAVLGGVDGVINLSKGLGATEAAPPPIAPPSATVSNHTLAELLSKQQRAA